MANIWELSVWVKVDKWSLNTATKEVQTEFKKTWDNIENNFTNRVKKGFAGLWSLVAGIFTVGAIVGFSKKLLGLWSDLEEVSSKFNVVFKWSEKVKEEFKNMADATNRSNLDLITFGSSIGNVLAPLGLAQSEVDGLSVSLTKLAIDVASFNNASDAQAVHAFTSALSGEREALKSLGIVISEADVQNKAYELGLAKQGAELTKAQKALSTYQLLIQNTANAHGDAIRTSASFANQLKGLQGAIKDVFANAGQGVANETAGLLKKITVFISSYGGAIIATIVETGKVVWEVVGGLIKVFWDLFGFIQNGNNENKDSMQSFAFVFMKVVQAIGVGVKLIALIISTLVKVIAVSVGDMVNFFTMWFKSIGEAFTILKTLFLGTINTIVDVIALWVEVIVQSFIGMAEAIVGVFKGVAENVAVAVKKATNLAIKGINGFIDLANKIPWVNMDRLLGLWDADFKPFELKVDKNLSAIKGKFDKYGANIKGNYAEIGQSFQDISDNYSAYTQKSQAVSAELFNELGTQWQDFAVDVSNSSDRIDSSLEKGAKKAQENAKLYDDGYFSILGLIDKYKGGVDEANKKTAKQGEVAKETMEKVKNLYKEWEKKIEDVDKAEKEFAENSKKYNQEIEDSLRSLNKELQNTTAEYNKLVWEINTDAGKDIASRGVEVAQEIIDVEKELADVRAQQTDDYTKQQEEILKLEAEKTALMREQEFIIANSTEAQRAEATRRAWLSDAEKIKDDANIEIAEKTRVFEAEKARIESLQRINEAFLQRKEFDQRDYNALIADERFLAMTAEEQELILKLAREKLELENQKNAIIQQQQEIHDATVMLSESATAIQSANIGKLKWEYATLIAQIQTAIATQQRLNALRNSQPWFAGGWFTGAGGTNEVKGVVHWGEWVAPKWMVNSMKPLFDNLENARAKGYASWGNVSTKNQTNNITVNWWMDVKSFMDYAKWRM